MSGSSQLAFDFISNDWTAFYACLHINFQFVNIHILRVCC